MIAPDRSGAGGTSIELQLTPPSESDRCPEIDLKRPGDRADNRT
jgi:hypothetical protein